MWFDQSNPIIREHLDKHPYHWNKWTNSYEFNKPRSAQRNYTKVSERILVQKAQNTPLPPSPETVSALEELQFIEEPLPAIEPRGTMDLWTKAQKEIAAAYQEYIDDQHNIAEGQLGPERAPEGYLNANVIQGAYDAMGRLKRAYRKKGRRYRKRYSYKQKKLYRDAMAMRKMKSRVFNRIYAVYGKPYRRSSYRRSYRRYRRR